MSFDALWSVLDPLRAELGHSAEADEDLPVVLRERLARLSKKELAAFELQFWQAVDDLDSDDLHAAVNVGLALVSDDWFEYFRYWVVSHGSKIYERIRADPEAFIELEGTPFLEEIRVAISDALADAELDLEIDRPATERPPYEMLSLEDAEAKFPRVASWPFRER